MVSRPGPPRHSKKSPRSQRGRAVRDRAGYVCIGFFWDEAAGEQDQRNFGEPQAKRKSMYITTDGHPASSFLYFAVVRAPTQRLPKSASDLPWTMRPGGMRHLHQFPSCKKASHRGLGCHVCPSKESCHAKGIWLTPLPRRQRQDWSHTSLVIKARI